MKAIIQGVMYDTDTCHELARRLERGSDGSPACFIRLMEAGDGRLLEWRDSNTRSSECESSLRSFIPKIELDLGKTHYSMDDFTYILDMDRLVKLGLISEAPACDAEIDKARKRSECLDELLCMDGLMDKICDLEKRIELVCDSAIDSMRKNRKELLSDVNRLRLKVILRRNYHADQPGEEYRLEEPSGGCAVQAKSSVK